MKRVCAVVVALLATTVSSQAALIVYADRASFDAAHPGVPVEGFESLDGTGTTSGVAGPLDATSSIPGVVSPGQILAGVMFSSPSNELFLAGPGQSSNPTTALGSNTPADDSLNLTFSPLVRSVAFDIFQNFGGGNQSGSDQDYLVSVYGAGAVLIGTTNVTVPSGGAGFLGVFSDSDDIEFITVLHSTAYEVIDNVAFGTAEVPEPGTGLMLAAGVLLIASRKLFRK